MTTATDLIEWVSVLFFITGAFLLFLRARQWRDTLKYDKTMAPAIHHEVKRW
jgi:Na+-translocating ferredoxin:NAD+ oxidoreductase RnfD subunit